MKNKKILSILLLIGIIVYGCSKDGNFENKNLLKEQNSITQDLLTLKEKNKEQRKLMGRIVMHDLKEFKQVLIQGEGKETKVLYEAVSNDKSPIYKYIIQNIGKGEILKKDAAIILSQSPLKLENIDLNTLNTYGKEIFYDDLNSTTQKSEVVLKKVEKKSQSSYQARGGDNFENCIAYYYIVYNPNTGETLSETFLFMDCDGPGANDPREDHFDDDDENETGGGGSNNSSCTQSLIDAQNLSNATLVSISESEVTTDIDAITKEKTLIWTCHTSYGGWYLNSKEKGTLKYFNISGGWSRWGWTSFSHINIEKLGSSPGGTVSPSNGTGTPVFLMHDLSPCTRQAMKIDYSITFSPILSNCPVIDQVITPYTYNYSNTSPTYEALP